jgi:hypothetical protein
MATPWSIDDRYTNETFDLQAVSQGKMVKTPCWNSVEGVPYKYMHVLRSNKQYFDAAAKNVDPRLWFKFEKAYGETGVSGLPIASEKRIVLVVILPESHS